MAKRKSKQRILQKISEEYSREPVPRLSSSDKQALVMEIVDIGSQPSDVAKLYEQYGSNLIWALQYAVADMLWSVNLDTSQRVSMVASLPLLLAALSRTDEVAIRQFWLSVLEFRELHDGDPESSHLLEAVRGALQIQLEMQNAGLQMSAINGLREVGGSEAKSIIQRAITVLVDETVRSYAGMPSDPDVQCGPGQPTDRI